MRSPRKNTSPSSGASRKLMHLRSVDLPDPLGPRIHIVVPLGTVTLMLLRTRCAPKLFESPRTSTAGTAWLCTAKVRRQLDAMHAALDREGHDPVQQHGRKKRGERHKVRGLNRSGGKGELGNSDDHQERGVFH